MDCNRRGKSGLAQPTLISRCGQYGQFPVKIERFSLSASSAVKRAGAELRALARSPGGRRFVELPASFVFLGDHWRFLDAIDFTGDSDDLGVVQEPVNDGPGSGHATQKFAPFVQRSVAGHDGRPIFVTAHDEFQQIFAGVFG